MVSRFEKKLNIDKSVDIIATEGIAYPPLQINFLPALSSTKWHKINLNFVLQETNAINC